MDRSRITGEEWEAFLEVADRLRIPVRDLLGEDVRFSVLEAAAHQLGRAVAQETAERLAGARAERAEVAYDCPTCGKRCPVAHKRSTTASRGPRSSGIGQRVPSILSKSVRPPWVTTTALANGSLTALARISTVQPPKSGYRWRPWDKTESPYASSRERHADVSPLARANETQRSVHPAEGAANAPRGAARGGGRDGRRDGRGEGEKGRGRPTGGAGLRTTGLREPRDQPPGRLRRWWWKVDG